MVENENTSTGISKNVRDRAKIHVIKFKYKYDSITDLVNKSLTQTIEDDEHDSESIN